MRKENFYRRDPAAALAGMAGMTLEEKGVYNTVLDLMYLTWRPLEDNRAYIAGHCGCAVQKLNPIIERLIEREKLIRFVEGRQTYLSNPTFEDERTAVKGPAKTRSGRGEGRQKSSDLEEKSAGVEENPPSCADETVKKQPVAALEKTREEKTSANALFVVEPTPLPKPKEKARVYPAEFEAAWKAYPHVKGRSSKPALLIEWKKLPADERSRMLDAVMAFSPKVAEVCGGKGAPCMARWVKDGKHTNWMDMDAAPSAQAGPARRFPGPPAIRAAVVAAKDEAWAVSWLDNCGYREPKTILCRTNFAADTLRNEVPSLERRGATIIVDPVGAASGVVVDFDQSKRVSA